MTAAGNIPKSASFTWGALFKFISISLRKISGTLGDDY
jgi:hypothetical protein